ncbi:NAD(P)/FAD-dependent oxidoreductase [Acetobacter conturbans]|uniref:FAD-dependent oxidoreductase n=1 Tax=Acetobacter conturbans TaxID=1737472 RepID=A0ABX0K5D8_9PROT|nr:FAD-binding oxidoreductase [Acetobacter conturbans]NHN89568.1 FAD-dependent oxidoreductase [Acetobacter conturbans]
MTNVTQDRLSHGLWAQTAIPSPAMQSLENDSRVDVAVIGAGYTGLSAALYLASTGRDVAVLEANEPGFGGSGRNVGLVNAGLWMKPKDVIGALGNIHGQRILTMLGEGPQLVFDLVRHYGLDCEATPTGTLHCAPDKAGLKELQDREKQWQALGAPVRLLNAEETRRQTGSKLYRGALLDERAGIIQPLSYARGLASIAQLAGATLYGDAAVTNAVRENGFWRLQTSKATVTAKWLLVATNAYTVSPWSAIREELIHLPYFNIATRPLSDAEVAEIMPDRQGCWDTKEVLTSFRLDKGNRLIIGSVGALGQPCERQVHEAWARRSLTSIYPQLQNIRFESAWYGMIGMTSDSVPRLHRLGDQAIAVSGYNGRGISPGTVFGRCLARYICGEISDGDMPLPFTALETPLFRRERELMYSLGSTLVHAVGARISHNYH